MRPFKRQSTILIAIALLSGIFSASLVLAAGGYECGSENAYRFAGLGLKHGNMHSSGAIYGNSENIPYEVWDPEVSSVAVRTLVDNSETPTQQVTMSMARIFEDLLKHQHSATEIYFVRSGRARLEIGEQVIDLKPGMFVYLPEGIPHWTKVEPGDPPLDIVYVFPKDTLQDVEYVMDGTVPISKEAPIIQSLDVPNGDEKVVRELVNRTEAAEEGLQMHQIYLPSTTDHMLESSEQARSVFVESGSGIARIDGDEIPLENGSYLYIPPGVEVELVGHQNLNTLVFQSNPPTGN